MIEKASKSIAVALAIAGVLACNPSQDSSSAADVSSILTVSPADFATEIDGDSVKLYTLTNGEMVAAITNYGARIVSLHVPDQNGDLVDVVLGYEDLANYRQPGEGFYGAVVGRYGNRIARGQFALDGQQHQLELNDGPNTLHGGTNGFFAKVWEVKHASDSSI